VTSKPFKNVNLMVGGPKGGEELYYAVGTETVIYPSYGRMRAQLCDESGDPGYDYEEHIYQHTTSVYCEADNKRYQLFVYQGIRKTRRSINL